MDVGKPLCRRWRFALGFALNAGSELALTSVSLVLAPLSILTAFGGFSVIFNAMISHFGFLQCVQRLDTRFFGAREHSHYDLEKMATKDWWGTLVVLIGATLISVSGPGSVDPSAGNTTNTTNDTVSAGLQQLQQMPEMIAQPGYIVFTAICWFIVIWWVTIIHPPICCRSMGKLKPPTSSKKMAVYSGCAPAPRA